METAPVIMPSVVPDRKAGAQGSTAMTMPTTFQNNGRNSLGGKLAMAATQPDTTEPGFARQSARMLNTDTSSNRKPSMVSPSQMIKLEMPTSTRRGVNARINVSHDPREAQTLHRGRFRLSRNRFSPMCNEITLLASFLRIMPSAYQLFLHCEWRCILVFNPEWHTTISLWLECTQKGKSELSHARTHGVSVCRMVISCPSLLM
mmetsp:Transcript_149280/g.416084  ORF Transcript_149280/g.416084 Transcript_149280/m.416084 type:complete len:204 (-) Transcript_149280:58-669(-)